MEIKVLSQALGRFAGICEEQGSMNSGPATCRLSLLTSALFVKSGLLAVSVYSHPNVKIFSSDSAELCGFARPKA